MMFLFLKNCDMEDGNIDGWMRGELAETQCMVWRPFATKLETMETIEGVALNMRASYFLPNLDSKQRGGDRHTARGE
jgi:hypothetical protein